MSDKKYAVYVNFDHCVYRITFAPGTDGFTYDEACAAVDGLTDFPVFNAEVIHEESGDILYIGVPEKMMDKVCFFAKEYKAA